MNAPLYSNRMRDQERAIAEEVWRDACCAFLGALFNGAPLATVQHYAHAVMASRAAFLATYRSSTP